MWPWVAAADCVLPVYSEFKISLTTAQPEPVPFPADSPYFCSVVEQVPSSSHVFRQDYTPRKRRIRIAVSVFFFGMGLCFASWASRIPDIKNTLQLSDAALGTLLFALPLGQLLIMPFSGKLVTRFGSQKVLITALCLYALSLTNMGLAREPWQLALSLMLFGLFSNLSNIAVNTQGVYAEELYGRAIMTGFHGVWSLAGFTGALTGLMMSNLDVSPYVHFWIVTAFVGLLILLNFRSLIAVENVPIPKAEKKSRFRKPDGALLSLGIVGFCSMAAEGAMFDWSGVYFQDVVKAPGSLVILGYTSFMIMMASGRFIGDFLINRIGRKRLMQTGGILISAGLFLSVFLPFLVPSVIAFMLVGLGVSTIVPIVYSLAGKNKTVAPGEALTIVSSVSFLGFLLGPPFIGYIAELWSLRISFACIGIFGICITLLVARMRNIS